MTAPDITSSANDRIKRLVRLRDRSERDGSGVFVVEGDRLLSAALEAGMGLVEIYASPGHGRSADPTSVVVAADVLDKASYRKRSEGVIAVFEQRRTTIDSLVVSSNPFVLLVEALEKPGNLGAILRTADATGADAVISVGTSADLYNPNTLRSSTGAAFSVPYVTTDLPILGGWLLENSMGLVVATPESSTTLWDVNLTEPVALAFGREDVGVSADLLAIASKRIAIPMAGQAADSLNVSVSAALVAYEVVRQRTVIH